MTTTDQTTSDGGQRPARTGERCTCGRPATVVYRTDRFGEVGWCGYSDGGATADELAGRP
ncbi:MAG: hypothetical protein ACR2LA_07195 [Acidimicrobiales bacterium]